MNIQNGPFSTINQPATWSGQQRRLIVIALVLGLIASVLPAAASANTAPVAVDDLAETPVDTPVSIDVLANDTDGDSDPLTVAWFDDVSFEGGMVARDPTNENILVYTPPAAFIGVDDFFYAADDGFGPSEGAQVSVYVGVPLSADGSVYLHPSALDFGAVPLGKTADIELTVTNLTDNPVGPVQFHVTQADPEPFDASARTSLCLIITLFPGDTCSQTVRFWSITDADLASPATLTIRDAFTFAALASADLNASTAPPVPPETPNLPPVAVDDVAFAASGFSLTLAPLWNDSDPDDDIITVTGATEPANGSLGGIVRCADHVFGSLVSPQETCIRYAPDAGFVGVDVIPYTIGDGRGGTAAATYYVAVGNPGHDVDAVDPASGTTNGGETLTVTGQNFLPGTQVTFICGGVLHPATSTEFVSPTQLTVTTPALPVGTCDVQARYAGLASGILSNAYTVIGGGALTASFTAPTTAGCAEAVSFDGSASTAPAGATISSYQWGFGDGSGVVGPQATVTHAYTSLGSFSVTLTVFDDATPANSAVTSQSITVANAAPTAEAGGPYQLGLGSALTLDGSGSTDADVPCGDVLTYAWDLDGDGATDATGATPTVSAADLAALGLGAGTHTIALTVTDASGVPSSDTASLTIQAPQASHPLRWSSDPDRSNPAPLEAATLRNRVAIFVPGTDAQIESVRFFIDGTLENEDDTAPFDLAGTLRNGHANMYFTRLLSNGQHTVTAQIMLVGGQVQVEQATFLVFNPGGPPFPLPLPFR